MSVYLLGGKVYAMEMEGRRLTQLWSMDPVHQPMPIQHSFPSTLNSISSSLLLAVSYGLHNFLTKVRRLCRHRAE